MCERSTGKLNETKLTAICTEVSKNFDKPCLARFKIVKAKAAKGFNTGTQYAYLMLEALDKANGWLYADSLFLPLRTSDLAKFSPGDVLVLSGTMHSYSGDSGYLPDPHDELELARLSREGLRIRLCVGNPCCLISRWSVRMKNLTDSCGTPNASWSLTNQKPAAFPPCQAMSSPNSIANLRRCQTRNTQTASGFVRRCRDKFKSRSLTLRFKVNQTLPGGNQEHAAWIGVMSPPGDGSL